MSAGVAGITARIGRIQGRKTGRSWDNRCSEAVRSCSSVRPLTHLIDATDRQDEMKATNAPASRVNANPICGWEDCSERPLLNSRGWSRGWCGAHVSRGLAQSRGMDLGDIRITEVGHEIRTAASGYSIRYSPEIGSIVEHVYQMEQRLGRKLVKGENVHHINGVRDDNRIENLELWTRPQPAGIRAADALDWAREIIARYGDAS
jgi:hypothetical protein